MDFVDKQDLSEEVNTSMLECPCPYPCRLATYTRDDFCLALFSPFCDFGVNLVSKLGLNFASIPSEQSEEALSSTIDHVYLMKRHCMNDLFAFLDFAFGALYKFGLRELNQL